MRRKRPYTEPDRIKERIRVISERKQFKSLGDLPYNQLIGSINRNPASPYYGMRIDQGVIR